MVYNKHKFKISSPNIDQKFIEWLRDNDIKIVDNNITIMKRINDV